MILGTGIDIVEIKRIQEALVKTAFRERVFSLGEIEYCESKNSQKFSSYAARFAAKEAFVKALGTGFRKGRFTDISVQNAADGKPSLVLAEPYAQIIKDKNIKHIHLSLSHSGNIAAAQVILEG